MTLFIADASSNNGHVNWTAARGGGLSGGIEKVTQGHSYVNPLWPDAKQQLELLARAHQDWLSGCYLFMDGESSGSTQAQFFIEHAGNLDHFFIMVDVERVAGLSPTIEQAMECVRMLKRHYGSKPIAGYAPHWYTGKAWLGFFDVLVASAYVGGVGGPEQLYERVPASWWAPYGGHQVDLLQFSPSVVMKGFASPADCSAWRGTFPELRTALMGRAAAHGMGFRREASGEKSLDQIAHDRHTTAAHIAHVTLNAAKLKDGERVRFERYWDNGKGSHIRMPKGLVFYTSSAEGGE